jgi:hypothetical protein
MDRKNLIANIMTTEMFWLPTLRQLKNANLAIIGICF